VTQATAAPQRDASSPQRVVLLVTAALFINYIDRGNLATAAPLLQDELHLSASQLGLLLSAFYYSYVLCMVPAGRLAERFGAHRVLAAGLTIWAVATLMTGLVHGFVALLLLRLLLGIGESVAFPCASKIFAGNVEVQHLGVANGVLGFGYLVGPAVGTLLGGYLMSLYGWRPVFVLFGGLSLLWLLPWRKVRVALAPKGQPIAGDVPPMRVILRQRSLWGASLGHFASNYSFYFILSWLPFYLVKSRGFSMGTMALIASWAYLLNALSALAMGWFADRWIRGGRSADTIYKSLMAVSHVAGIVCMAGMVLLPVTGSIISLFLLQLIAGFSYPGVFAIPQILAGPQASGSWVGVQNAAGNVAGLLAPVITGVLVDQTGQFGLAFALAAGVNLLGLIGWLVVLPKVEPIDWDREVSRHA
jgi:MFS family permease